MGRLRELSPRLTLHTSGLSGPKEKALFPAGRAWVYVHDRWERTVQTFHWEWHFGRKARHTGLEMTLNAVDGDNGIRWMIGLWKLFCLFFTIERVPKWLRPYRITERWGKLSVERCVGVRVFGGAVWIDLWNNPNEGSSTDPWWWQTVIHPLDILLGRERSSKRILNDGSCAVPMPERDYAAKATLYEITRKRPRWPWVKAYQRVEIETDEPIPLPGKGTTEYNCGDDASYSVSMPCRGSVGEAAKEYAADLVRERVRLCGREVYP